jgi:hypothetical protein
MLRGQFMTRGGKREGAGGKFKWIHGKTKIVRVPEVLADRILAIAKMIDEGKTVDDVTQSKYIDLSGVTIRNFGGSQGILIEDLLKSGYKVRPFGLVDLVRKQIDRKF